MNTDNRNGQNHAIFESLHQQPEEIIGSVLWCPVRRVVRCIAHGERQRAQEAWSGVLACTHVHLLASRVLGHFSN